MCYLMAIISKTVLMAVIITQGSHKNLRKKFHDFSMTSPGQNPNFLILMQFKQPANNSKNASDHCCDQFFLCVLITEVQND